MLKSMSDTKSPLYFMPMLRVPHFISVLLLLLMATSAFANNATVKEVRMWRSPDNTRIVLDLDKSVEHKIFVLENPHRVVLDIPRATMKANTTAINWSGSPVQSMRTGEHGKNNLRIVFDLAHGVQPKSFFLKKSEGFNDRLVLDFQDPSSKKSSTATATRSVSASQDERRDLIVAIDAGHGGEDPGAIGPGRIYEKHVVLAIAKELERLLQNTQGYKPVLIRSGDYFVGLGTRRDLARKAQADLFISIHADAFTSPHANGSSVFALSTRGATSTLAQFLADKENLSDLVGGVSLNDKDEVLTSILADLSITHKQEASLDVGSSILREMGQISRLHSKRVELASFAVLRTPDIPSILIETGFISNPAEAKKLSTPAYQRQMAKAIFTGMDEFFNRRPLEGTYIAWKNRNRATERRYVVSRGDTLSSIANRYSVSMNDIRSHNNLASNNIHIGQELRIPIKP